LPIIYINGIVSQLLNNNKINFSLNTKYIKNRISIENVIILVIFCFIFYEIKIYIFSNYIYIFKPDYCCSGLSNYEIDSDWANKEIKVLERKYMPVKRSEDEVYKTTKY